VRCVWDGCCSFDPRAANHIYCTEHKCKRRAENAKKRLGKEVTINDPEAWELQDRRKVALAERARAKNEWLLKNRTIVSFDIETFDLAADYGVVMVACIKTRGGDTQTFIARNDGEERACLLATRRALEEADYVVTYYGTGFDIPYLNTRLIIKGERPIGKLRHVDLYYTAKFKLKLNRNRLQNVEMALFGESEKTEILPGIWRRALRGDNKALKYIADHCQKDVAILERCFLKLRGFINLGEKPLKLFGRSY
jgi:uncharacterized protein YprB with RNaseH-like and TPR domain